MDNKYFGRTVVVLGGGGYGKVLIDTLHLAGTMDVAVADPALPVGASILGAHVMGDDDAVFDLSAESIMLANGIGSTTMRQEIFERFSRRGYVFCVVVHPRAFVSPRARLGQGAHILAGAVIQAGAEIGDDAIINIGANIDHDCRIGAHAHVAPGASLSGHVVVGCGALIGTGASVIQNVHIGDRAIIGGGSAVVRNIPADAVAKGVPAR